jgi:FlaA1/EpsC-like NDP-sugar epimerase
MKPNPTLIGGDAIAITLFVLLGLSSHEGIDVTGWARNAIPLTLSWLVVGGALGVFRREVASNLTTVLQRVAIAWPIAAVIGVVARYMVVGHGLEISFIIVTILTNLVILLAWRTAYALARRTKRQEASS